VTGVDDQTPDAIDMAPPRPPARMIRPGIHDHVRHLAAMTAPDLTRTEPEPGDVAHVRRVAEAVHALYRAIPPGAGMLATLYCRTCGAWFGVELRVDERLPVSCPMCGDEQHRQR